VETDVDEEDIDLDGIFSEFFHEHVEVLIFWVELR